MHRSLLALLFVLTGLLAPAWASNPTVGVSADSATTTVSPIVFTITFDQPVTGLVTTDLTVTNGSVMNLQQVTSGTYSQIWKATIVPTAQGAVTLFLAAGVATNSASETSQLSNTASVTYDTPPTATVTIPAVSPSSVTFSIHFDQTWSISDISKVTVSGGSITSQNTVTATPFNTYDVVLAPYGNGTVAIQVGAGAFTDGTLTTAATSGSVTVGPASTGTEARVTSLQFVSPADRSYTTGETVDFDVIFSRPVTVMGLPVGAPAVVLNATGSASTASTGAYQSTAGSHVRLRLTVLAGHYTPALDATGTTALSVGNGGGIVGDDGYLALLTLPTPGSAASLRGSGAIGINYTAPKPPVDEVAGKSTTDSCGLGSGVGLVLGSLFAGLALARRRR